MSAERLAGLADTYRRVAAIFAVEGHEGPMLAHQEAATLIDRARIAIAAAHQSAATMEWQGPDAARAPDIAAFYQPNSESVCVVCDNGVVSFSEQEAEALSAVLQEALLTRDRALRFVDQAGWERLVAGSRPFAAEVAR